jgi:hypothetical protein
MSFSTFWRRVALAFALLLAAGAVIAMKALPGAEAQEPPPSATFVFGSIPVTASNGHVNLGPGTGTSDGVLGVACTGAGPRSGTARIPGMVVTELLTNSTLLRIIQPNGAVVNGNVTVNCVAEVEVTPTGTATAERLRAAAEAG